MVYFSIDRAFSSVLSCRRDPIRQVTGDFKHILPYLADGSHLGRRLREYGQSDDWDRAVGGKTSAAFSFLLNLSRLGHRDCVGLSPQVTREGGSIPVMHKRKTSSFDLIRSCGFPFAFDRFLPSCLEKRSRGVWGDSFLTFRFPFPYGLATRTA